MRSVKFFLILGFILISSAVAKADEFFVSANVEFHQQAAGDTRQFTFSTHFLYDLETSQLVPGTMYISIVDTLGGTPFTDFVPKPNFHGPVFTYFDSDLDAIQLSFYAPGWPYEFPTIGSYPTSETRLYCVTDDCAQHFATNREVLHPVAGELSISAVPEPRSGLLVIFGALATMGLFAITPGISPRVRG